MGERSLSLSNLSPAQQRQDRKRVGRGLGSGKGRYSGRGIKGQKARSGSRKMRAGFEGGQMPAYMRLPKQKAQSADAMPIGPFRTETQAVNLRDLESRFDAGAEVTVDALKDAGLIRNTRVDVKILGQGDLTKKLTVTAHRFSGTARQKIEAAGGTVTALRDEEQQPRSRKRRKIAARKRATGSQPEPAAQAEAGGEAEASD